MRSQFDTPLTRSGGAKSVQASGPTVDWEDDEEAAKFYVQITDCNGVVAIGRTAWVPNGSGSWRARLRTRDAQQLTAGPALGTAFAVVREEGGWDPYLWGVQITLE